MALNPYSITARCEKCGTPGFHGVEYVVLQVDATTGQPAPGMEYLERTCLRCGYRWREACVS